MANMSYCRFQNTVNDLQDCVDADGMYDPEDLSDDERRARERLIDLCLQVAGEFGEDY